MTTTNKEKVEPVLIKPGSWYVSVATVIAIVVGAIGVMQRLYELKSQIVQTQMQTQVQLESLRVEIMQVNDRLSARMADRWTGTMMHAWERELRDGNPALRVPNVQAIIKDYPPASN